MEIVRNMSDQSFIINRKGGNVVHLFPGRAVALSDEELKTLQVQCLLQGSLMRLEKIEKKVEKTAIKTGKKEEEKKAGVIKHEKKG